MIPELPRFENFFQSLSKGKHPFEEEEFKYTKQEEDEKLRKEDEKYDEELQERELYGRMLGQELTPR